LALQIGWPLASAGGDAANWLVTPFEDDEVFEVVRAHNRDKTPGLDGFTIGFFQAY